MAGSGSGRNGPPEKVSDVFDSLKELGGSCLLHRVNMNDIAARGWAARAVKITADANVLVRANRRRRRAQSAAAREALANAEAIALTVPALCGAGLGFMARLSIRGAEDRPNDPRAAECGRCRSRCAPPRGGVEILGGRRGLGRSGVIAFEGGVARRGYVRLLG